jgi:hypothetical protein
MRKYVTEFIGTFGLCLYRRLRGQGQRLADLRSARASPAGPAPLTADVVAAETD